GLYPGRSNAPLAHKLFYPANVDRTPVAARPTRCKTNFVALGIYGLAQTVDPTEAKCLIHRFGPCNAGTSGRFPVKADPLLAFCLMMFLQPCAKSDRFREKDWRIFRRLHLTEDRYAPANFPIAISCDRNANYFDENGQSRRKKRKIFGGGAALSRVCAYVLKGPQRCLARDERFVRINFHIRDSNL